MPKKFSLELRERAVRMILKRQATQGASFARDPSHGTVSPMRASVPRWQSLSEHGGVAVALILALKSRTPDA